jgi:hypothetical protein
MTADDSASAVTVALRRPSKSPSVFLLASFTEPAWEPVELDAKPLTTNDTSEDGADPADLEYEFSASFKLPEGSHKYRFRLGSDDTWLCNEDVAKGEYFSN